MTCKMLSLSAAILMASLAASAAQAATAPTPAPAAAIYTLEPDPLTPGVVSTSPTVTVGSGTTVDDFTFTLTGAYDTAATGLYFELPAFGYAITSEDLTLYSGTPSAPGSYITTTGSFDPATSASETLGADLSSGSYFVQASTTVPSGETGAFSIGATVSAAPEPSAWGLMILGVGVMGAALRVSRYSRAVAIA